MKQSFYICILILSISFYSYSKGYLYPVESESRQVKNLNGLWLFLRDYQGFAQKWYTKDFRHIDDYEYIPVPGSFNEIFPDFLKLWDYLGWVWYQREVYIDKKWSGQRIFLYFGAVDHHAVIWCNGGEVGRHSGGHVPFHVEITRMIHWSQRNVLTVAVNNTLTSYTIPQGFVSYPNDTTSYPKGTYLYSHNFDYFDYAGINRNVFLYSVPQNFIKELDVVADTIPKWNLNYEVKPDNNRSPFNCTIKIIDEKGDPWVTLEGCKNTQSLKYEKGLAERSWLLGNGKQFIFEVKLKSGKSEDIYRTQIGFRTIEWEETDGLRINGHKVYLTGFGMHEDADIRGRGYDDVTTLRDIALLKWTGANSMRTSHYPYSEEFLIQCDIEGIGVILEMPACSLTQFSEELYKEHERITLEIIGKYKHHPSIIMWSLANEPATDNNASTSYFRRLYKAAKAADSTRPISFATNRTLDQDKAIGDMDVVLLNRYKAWYQDCGRLDLIEYQIKNEISKWHKKYNKTVIVTEYGADSLPGQTSMVPLMWTENYQTTLLEKHFKVFDDLKKEGVLGGEMIWNLIDFKTPQEYFRPGFCMKGVFTRQREPKESAHVVRQRYKALRSSQKHPLT